MTDAGPLDATAVPAMPVEIVRLRRSKSWRRCRTEPFLAFYLVNLWCAAFHGIPAGSLEDDDESLAELAGCPPLEWSALRSIALHGWQKREDGRIYHPIVEAKAREALALSGATKRAVRQSRTTDGMPCGFLEWWAEYPRKIAQGAAKTAYERALRKTGAVILLEGAKRFAHQVRLREPQFICFPATWLNQERWRDGMPKEITTKANKINGLISKIAPNEITSEPPVPDDVARLRFAELRSRLNGKGRFAGGDPDPPN